jgi:hypothetical protein
MLHRMIALCILVGTGWGCSADTKGTGTTGTNGSSGTNSGGAGGTGTGGAAGSGAGGEGGFIFTPDGGSGACAPVSMTETICDGKDDDCNGRVDDVDTGKDGICDCLRIGIIGSPGSNPSADFQAWLQARGTTVERTHTTAGEAFDAALLAKYDVLIFDRLPREYTAEEADKLKAWMEARGGFVTMTGYTGAPAPDFYTNALLAPIGLEYQAGLYTQPVTIFANHPVTAGLTSVTFAGGYLVKDLGGNGGTNTAIGSISAGPVAFAHERGNGRAVVWGDEWIEFDSEWKSLPEIEQLWVNMIAWVGPQDSCQVTVPK